jgi:hypothetical protein
MERFSFVTPVTGLNRPNTGKEDDDDEVHLKLFTFIFLICIFYLFHTPCLLTCFHS